MAIITNNKKVIAIYQGDTKIAKVMKGNRLIFGKDEGGEVSNNLSFEFIGDVWGDNLAYKLNNNNYTATTSPYSVDITTLDNATPLTNVEGMFKQRNITRLISLPDMKSVTNITEMFMNCSELTGEVDLSKCNLRINGEISIYDKYDNGSLFYGCTKVTSINLTDVFNPDNIPSNNRYTKLSNTFCNCQNLTTLILDGCHFFKDATINSTTFADCNNLKTIYLRNSDASTLDYINRCLTTSHIDNVTIITE